MYVELHALSNFSFLRGASHPEELVEQAKELNYSGLALTDECSLDRRSTRLNSSHLRRSRMPSSA